MRRRRSRILQVVAALLIAALTGTRLYLATTAGLMGDGGDIGELREFWQPQLAPPMERRVAGNEAMNWGGPKPWGAYRRSRKKKKKKKKLKKLGREKASGAARDGKIPYFLHVHKSGGTMLCATAEENGETVPPRNCNQMGDGPHTLNQFPSTLSLNCTQRYGRAVGGGYTFVAVERFLAPGELDCPDHFLYVLMVRDPVERVMSHADVHGQRAHPIAGGSAWQQEVDFLTDHRHRDRMKPLIHARYSRDNYLTRTLLGKIGFNGDVPEGGVNGTHADVAKRAIDKFDIVLCLEEFDYDAVQLERFLGWTGRVGRLVNARSDERKKRGEQSMMFSLPGKAEGAGRRGGERISASAAGGLKDTNAIDYDVYWYARERARELSEVAGEEVKAYS